MYDKYFSVIGFKMLEDVLTSYTIPKGNYMYEAPYSIDVDELANKMSYNDDDLDVGDYETKHFNIKVFKSYVTSSIFTTVYEVTRKD